MKPKRSYYKNECITFQTRYFISYSLFSADVMDEMLFFVNALELLHNLSVFVTFAFCDRLVFITQPFVKKS